MCGRCERFDNSFDGKFNRNYSIHSIGQPGQPYFVEQVWIKTEPVELVEPVDVESADFVHIKTEEGVSIVKIEPSIEITSNAMEDVPSAETVSMYVCVPSSVSTVPPLTEIKKPRTKSRNLKKFACDDCDAVFTVKSNFVAHQNRHKGVRPFACDLCGKAFFRKQLLIRHIQRHSGERPFSCDICGVRFAQKGHVKPHKRIHTGERPYKCDECGQTFTKGYGLKMHKRQHLDPSERRMVEKRFACDLCGKTFTRKEGLDRHNRFHNGERPFGCDICGQRFSQSGHATQHRRKHGQSHSVSFEIKYENENDEIRNQ